ncbi:hypothetical protein SO802_010021 [Lithocarpus litseifolius]|uniref:G-patch domain-containing protein n=1 Tax=Lithocarpus litseifolius TaxID=425828 RepID=A0AAW2DE95_9ROSI
MNRMIQHFHNSKSNQEVDKTDHDPLAVENFKKEPLTLDGFEIERPGFKRREQEVEKIPMDFASYGNNNVVALMRRMNYLPGMNLGRTVKKPTVQVPMIPTAAPPFGLGYKPTNDDLLEMDVRKMARAKAKAKGLPCPPEPLKPYTPTLNGKFVKVGESQHYWGFLKPRFDPVTKTMVLGLEILLDCNNKDLEPKKEDTTWVPTDWVDYMDPDAMTTLLGDAIYNIEEEEYCEACQHALKSSYELRANNEDEEGGAAHSDDEDGSNDKSDRTSDSNNSDSGHDDDESGTDNENNSSRDYDIPYSGDDWGERPSDREDEDAKLFYEEYGVDYYDEDIEDDAEANRWKDTDSDQYKLINVLENAREENAQANQVYHDEYPYGNLSDWSDITNVSSWFGPRCDKHGRKVPELGSYYDSEPSSPTSHIEEEDDIDARLAILDQKLMVHSLKIMTFENAERNDERMEGDELEHLLQPTYLGNKGKHDLFDEWMDNIERLDAFITEKPTDMEIEEEATDYIDVDPPVLMLKEEGAYWEPPTIVEATTELKKWAWEGAAYPMEDSVRKIKIVKSVTFTKKIETIEPITPAKNIVSVPIESISASVSIPIKSVCGSFPFEFVESVESVKNSFPF